MNYSKLQQYIFIIRPWASLVCIALLAFCLYTFGLGNKAFLDYDEAAYAEVVSETIQDGNIFALKFAKESWHDKPPFYFWAAMISEKIFHPFSTIGTSKNGTMHPTEFTMRFPSAASGVIAIVLIWLIVFERTNSKRLASFISLVLLSTGAFIDNTRQVRLDVPVTAAMLFSFYSYMKVASDRRWVLGVWVGIATAVMLKSVIGLFAVPIIILDIFILNGYTKTIEDMKSFFVGQYAKIGLLVVTILIIPWHIYQTILYGSAFWNKYLFVHVIERFGTNLFSKNVSLLDYFGGFLGGALPWSVIFIILLPLCLAPTFFADKARYKLFLTSTISALGIFIIFAISRTKALSYLVPIYPFVAISVGLGIQSIRHHYFNERTAKHTTNLLAVIACIFVTIVAFAACISIGFRQYEPLKTETVFAEEERIIGGRILPAPPTAMVYYTTPDSWETVRFYSGGKTIKSFDRDDISNEGVFYIVTTRSGLPNILNSPAVKFAQDFNVKFMGTYFALIEVEGSGFTPIVEEN